MNLGEHKHFDHDIFEQYFLGSIISAFIILHNLIKAVIFYWLKQVAGLILKGRELCKGMNTRSWRIIRSHLRSLPTTVRQEGGFYNGQRAKLNEQQKVLQ